MLSQTSHYVLRAVVCIAQKESGGAVLAKDIARETGVPFKYLQKLLGDLVREGLLESTRGKGGGFKLKTAAAHLRLADIMAPFAGAKRLSTCPFGFTDCHRKSPCPVHDKWHKVIGTLREFLETTTLGDLLEESDQESR